MEKIALITGSTDGIGLTTAIELAQRDIGLIIHGRNPEKISTAIAAIKMAAPQAPLIRAVQGDFAIMTEVVAIAAQIKEITPKLDIIIHNAGTYELEQRITADGFELTMAINHFAPFLLTQQVLPLLAKNSARIVIVSSIAHLRGTLDTQHLDGAGTFTSYGAYAASKLANVLFTFGLAKRLPLPITANCLHPGVINTKLLRRGFKVDGAPLKEGAKTSVYLATSPEIAKITGQYFDNCQIAPTNPIARNDELVEEFWHASERLLQQWLN